MSVIDSDLHATVQGGQPMWDPPSSTDLGRFASDELLRLCLGPRLGGGISREVYVWGPDPRYVIKLTRPEARCSNQNTMEWETWRQVMHYKPAACWLAPCWMISRGGGALLQRRTRPIPRSRLPTHVPRWATDLKPENWGLLNGRPVMHDYGLTLMLSRGSQTSRLKKADW